MPSEETSASILTIGKTNTPVNKKSSLWERSKSAISVTPRLQVIRCGHQPKQEEKIKLPSFGSILVVIDFQALYVGFLEVKEKSTTLSHHFYYYFHAQAKGG